MSVLKPEGSVAAALATAGLTYGVYSFSLPNTATMHATAVQDVNLEAGRKKAAWTSAAVISAISLITKDKTIFVLGGLMLIALDWHARHGIAASPETGKVASVGGYTPAAQSVPVAEQAVSVGV